LTFDMWALVSYPYRPLICKFITNISPKLTLTTVEVKISFNEI
jgi:hypothetical protein